MKWHKLEIVLGLVLLIIGELCLPKFLPNLLAEERKSEGFFEGLRDAITDVFGLDPEKDLKKALLRSSSEWEDDILNSEKADWQLSSVYKLIEKSFLQEKCQEVAEKIIRQTPYPNLPIQVKIINSTEVNAFSTCGKYVYVNSGLLSTVKSEDAIAFIISHEIGHTMAKHIKRQEKGEMWGNLMVIITKPKSSEQFEATKKLVNARYSVDFEREADVLGAIFAYKAGYNIEDGAKFFLELWKKEEQAKQKLLLSGNIETYRNITIQEMFFATHPPLPERIKLLNQTKRVLEGTEKTHPLPYVFKTLYETGFSFSKAGDRIVDDSNQTFAENKTETYKSASISETQPSTSPSAQKNLTDDEIAIKNLTTMLVMLWNGEIGLEKIYSNCSPAYRKKCTYEKFTTYYKLRINDLILKLKLRKVQISNLKIKVKNNFGIATLQIKIDEISDKPKNYPFIKQEGQWYICTLVPQDPGYNQDDLAIIESIPKDVSGNTSSSMQKNITDDEIAIKNLITMEIMLYNGEIGLEKTYPHNSPAYRKKCTYEKYIEYYKPKVEQLRGKKIQFSSLEIKVKDNIGFANFLVKVDEKIADIGEEKFIKQDAQWYFLATEPQNPGYNQDDLAIMESTTKNIPITEKTEQKKVFRTFNYEEAWKIITYAISENYEVEVEDGNVGYLRTKWKNIQTSEKGNPTVRVRIILMVDNKEPLKFHIKAEKQKLNETIKEWVNEEEDKNLEENILKELVEVRLKLKE